MSLRNKWESHKIIIYEECSLQAYKYAVGIQYNPPGLKGYFDSSG